jgi:hypothetical protein
MFRSKMWASLGSPFSPCMGLRLWRVLLLVLKCPIVSSIQEVIMTPQMRKPIALLSTVVITCCVVAAAFAVQGNKKGDESASQPKANQAKGAKLPPAVPRPSNGSESKKRTDETIPEDIASILTARVKLAQAGYDGAVEMLNKTQRQGNTLVYIGKPEDAYQWSLNLLDAERDLKDDAGSQRAALDGHLNRMKQLEEKVGELSHDLLPKSEVWKAEWHRLNAQLWLERAKSQ